jgi:GDPmannose 4,6-dehydratase
MKRKALITGISGQDGAYLAETLLERGYEVVGTVRRTSTHNDWRLHELGVADRLQLRQMELLEFANILDVIREERPTAIFNLAAQSFVETSFRQPLFTSEVDALAVTRLLEAIRLVDPEIRFYQASTSEMFGKVRETPQNEETPFYPRSPYGVAKLYAHWITVNYREAHGIHATSGILYNHESPLRGREFVTRKITSHLALYRAGLVEGLQLGNLDARRDWGHAKDYVRGMVAMLEHETPDSFVLATGENHSVRDFVTLAARAAGLELEWEGEGVDERGIERATGKAVVTVNPDYYRPAEVDVLIGDASKARRVLDWKPEIAFEDMVEEMVRSDGDRLARGQPLL